MKKIISKETIAFVQNMYREAVAKSNKATLCVPADIHNGFSVGIGKVRVSNVGKDSYLYISNDVGKEYMKEWKKDIGGVYSSDCKKNNLSDYYKFSYNDTDVLLRRISDEELNDFESKGFVHVKLGDFNYMIVKVVLPEHSFVSFDSTDEDFSVVDTNTDEEEDEEVEEEPEVESLSLF